MLPRMRLFPATSLLCVIDVQERLLAVVPEADRVVARCRRLADAARLLGVRTVLTETFGASKTTPSAHQQGIGCGRAIGRAILQWLRTCLRECYLPDYSSKMSFDRITFDTAIMGGRACVRGLRIPVTVILKLLAGGMTPAEILIDYPDLERGDIEQCIAYAAALADDQVVAGA